MLGLGLEAVILAAMVVVGVSCLHLVSTARRRLRRTAALSEAIQTTLHARGREEAVDELLEAVRRIVRADEAWLVFVQPGTALPLGAERRADRSVRLRQTHLSRAERRLLEALRTERAVLRSGRRTPKVLADVLERRGVAHGMVVEVRGDAASAALLFVGRKSGRRFDADERDLFALVADHAGAVLENDRLERSLQEVVVLKEQLRHRADHDALTGLPNRALFTARLDRALRDGAPGSSVAALFLDLDDFKDVNDTLGHQAGDELLVAVARRLSNTIRPGDIAARLGGDEFAVLVECVRPDDGERVATRVVEALDAPFHVGGTELLAHTSIGIAYGAPGRISADDVLRNADLAMYEAKSSGKRRFARYEPAMQDRLRRRRELVSALERAPLQGEIGVHYQPIVDLGTGQLIAVEALARWNRPALGLVEPSGFIGIADEVGLMAEIGRSVRREACAQARDWQRLFPGHTDLGVAVNLAPTELHDDALVADVQAVLDETGLAPSALTLEITESGVMRQPEVAMRTMHQLRDLGVSLALDDFGTGHSSLAHLRAFPLDVLKIAQPFLEGLEADGRETAFVETIVRLGASLGLDVVAEGIETRRQAEIAASLDCKLGQGYHFGRPVSPLGVTAYLAAARLPGGAPGYVAA